MIWWNCLICARSFYTQDEIKIHIEVFKHKVSMVKS
jgi:hypothetical protein